MSPSKNYKLQKGINRHSEFKQGVLEVTTENEKKKERICKLPFLLRIQDGNVPICLEMMIQTSTPLP